MLSRNEPAGCPVVEARSHLGLVCQITRDPCPLLTIGALVLGHSNEHLAWASDASSRFRGDAVWKSGLQFKTQEPHGR